MSVFNDFQKAWAAKFPGCDLPQAWEEDVRANLSRHRHKVAVLKEQLEKEEFYVEYLERLLADVEKHKHNSSSTLDNKHCSGEEALNDSSENGLFDSDGKKSLSTPDLVDTFNEIKNSGAAIDIKGIADDTGVFKDELHLPLLPTQQPAEMNDDILLGEKRVKQSSANEAPETGKQNDGNQYVTVIKVGSYSPSPTRNVFHPSGTEGTGPETNQQKASVEQTNLPATGKTKVPPKPPPKRSKRMVTSASIELIDAALADLTSASDKGSENSLSEKSLSENVDSTNELTPAEPQPLPSASTNGDCHPEYKRDLDAMCQSPEVNGCCQKNECDTFEVENTVKHVAEVNEQDSISPEMHTSTDDLSMSLHSQTPSDSHTPDNSERLGATVGNARMEMSTEELESDYVTFSFEKNEEYDDLTLKSQASIQSGQSGYSSHSGPSSDHDCLTSSPIPPDSDSPKYSDYVNIDYFLRRKACLKHRSDSHSESFAIDSDDEDSSTGLLIASLVSDPEEDGDKPDTSSITVPDDVFDIDSGVYSSSVESTSYIPSSTPPAGKKVAPTSSTVTRQSSPAATLENEDCQANKAEAERIAMYRCIINSILESEAIYLECLTVLLQYMKALRATFSTSQPVMTQEDFAVIFFKIPELHSLHDNFQDGIRNRTQNWDGKRTIGDHFKILASKLGVYASFLQNYPHAVETVRKCSNENVQFSEITKTIKLKTLKGQAMSLEDLLHKPVARVQKNALVLHDLIKYTPESHPDYKTLRTALKMTQCFLNDFNMSAAESMFPTYDRTQRHLVKNSFIVELAEGHRKLRHLFLFNDVIVCAKYKASGREKFTFEVKWHIPITEVTLPNEEDSKEIRESSPANVLSLRTQASTLRDQIKRGEKHNSNDKQRISVRSIDKHRKKLAELEAQLVLASPNLAFRIGQKHGKTYTFFLSSSFETQQWIEAVNNLQASASPTTPNLTSDELQAWITTCRKYLKTNMGAFLLRSGKEDLLVGDLHVTVKSLQGLPRPAVLFLCLEIDSYGNFFRKAKSKSSFNSIEPVWNQEFILELEGSQNFRILCYEEHPQQGTILRAKTTIELNRQWLPSKPTEKTIALQELLLTVSVKYTSGEMTLRRAPSAKPSGLFGIKIQQVCKKEKRPIPFLITSCVREVDKRGMSEVGIYRVSGSASDVQKLKKAFETNAYEAEQLLKEVDVHSITGLLKLYLRELPEALFTDSLYPKFFEAFSVSDNEIRSSMLLRLFASLPQINQSIIIFLVDHMVKINQQEVNNKMSLHNLATVFGPTLLRPGSKCDTSSPSDLLAAETIDVMAQAGILYFFLQRQAAGEVLQTE